MELQVPPPLVGHNRRVLQLRNRSSDRDAERVGCTGCAPSPITVRSASASCSRAWRSVAVGSRPNRPVRSRRRRPTQPRRRPAQKQSDAPRNAWPTPRLFTVRSSGVTWRSNKVRVVNGASVCLPAENAAKSGICIEGAVRRSLLASRREAATSKWLEDDQ